MPDREFVLITPLTPDQVMDALNRRSEVRGAKVHPVAALFEAGAISSDRFELQLMGQRNHAKANIHGQITLCDGGSKVAVRIGSSDLFGVVWSSGCVLGALVALLSIRSWAQVPAGLGVAMGAMVLLALYRFLSLKAFDLRASTAELALKDVLSAKTATPGNVR